MPNMIPVDIREDQPFSRSTTFVLDANVILYTFYGDAIQTTGYQRKYYPEFVQQCADNNNALVVTAATLSEVFHVIEKNECRLYNNNHNHEMQLKEFRAISEERKKVAEKTDLIYRQIREIKTLKIIESTISEVLINSYIGDFNEIKCDFFDYHLIKIAKDNGYCIVTDDFDFSSVAFYGFLLSANSKFFKN